MKEQILKLIHKELENVGGENIFHDCYNPRTWHCGDYLSPYKKNSIEIKSNCERGSYYVSGYPVCDQIDTVDEFKVTDVEKHNLEYGSYLEIVIDAYYDSIFPYVNLEHLEWELSQEAGEIIGKGTIQVKLNGINKRKNFDW